MTHWIEIELENIAILSLSNKTVNCKIWYLNMSHYDRLSLILFAYSQWI
jgi:hypothetical protein